MPEPDLLELYKQMVLIRTFEERLETLFSKGLVKGTCHLYIGQEAVAVGACAALTGQDYVISNHRGHGHFIARGGDPKRIMAEMFGRVDGYSRGRGGSQHMADLSIGFLGSNGITCGGTPIAAGAALRLKQAGRPGVVVSFIGDGATNQGVLYESLNMAAVWKLPVVYICENNFYGMSTPVEQVTAVGRLAERPAAFGVHAVTIDGNNVLGVHRAVAEARERATSGGGPQFVECTTYRFCGHSRGDPRVYRTRDEEAEAYALCPIPQAQKLLLEQGLATQEVLDEVARRAEKMVDDCEAFARNSPMPDPSELNDPVFA